jgi:hypothetical protein
MRRADRSPLKFNAKLSEPFSIVPTRLQAPCCNPATHTLLKALTFRIVIEERRQEGACFYFRLYKSQTF